MMIKVDIEVYDPPSQARYLAHGVHDCMWTDSLTDALAFLRVELTDHRRSQTIDVRPCPPDVRSLSA